MQKKLRIKVLQRAWQKLNYNPNVQECDARGDAISSVAGNKKYS